MIVFSSHVIKTFTNLAKLTGFNVCFRTFPISNGIHKIQNHMFYLFKVISIFENIEVMTMFPFLIIIFITYNTSGNPSTV